MSTEDFITESFCRIDDRKDWHPHNLRLCQRGEWNDRMMVETTLSMLTLVCH